MRHTFLSGMAALAVAIVWACIIGTPPAQAETFVPNSFLDAPDDDPGDGVCDSDSGPGAPVCTLRAAVMEANEAAGPDTIELAAGVYEISLPGYVYDNGDFDVTDDLRVVGEHGTVIDGGDLERIFDADEAVLMLENMTLRNGSSYGSGGAVKTNSSMVLSKVKITDCEAPTGGGGAVFLESPAGHTTIVDTCWIHDNRAVSGGGIKVLRNGVNLVISNTTITLNVANGSGGGVWSLGDLYLSNCTVVANIAPRSGGGILSHGRLRLASTTVSANWCDFDGDDDGSGCGVWIWNQPSEVRNTIIAGNLNWSTGTPVNEPDDCDGDFISTGYNLIGFPGSSCTGFSAATHDLVGDPLLDAELGSIGDNGGFGHTRVPEPGSPAIDAGDPTGCFGDLDGDWSSPPTLLAFEQRGYPRVLDDNGDGIAVCTIGAVEMALFADGFESGGTAVWK